MTTPTALADTIPFAYGDRISAVRLASILYAMDVGVIRTVEQRDSASVMADSWAIGVRLDVRQALANGDLDKTRADDLFKTLTAIRQLFWNASVVTPTDSSSITATFDLVDEHGNIFLDLTIPGVEALAGLCIVYEPQNDAYALSGTTRDCWADSVLEAWLDADTGGQAIERMSQIEDIVAGAGQIEGVAR